MKRALTVVAIRCICMGRGLTKIQADTVSCAAIRMLEAGAPARHVLTVAWHSMKFLHMVNVQAESAMFTTTEGLGVDAEGNRKRRLSFRQRAALRRYRS